MPRKKMWPSIKTGDRFGRLTAIGDETDNYVECRCDCGVTKRVRRDHLRTGAIASCGTSACRISYDLTGIVFGRLTVVKREMHKGRMVWLCMCECGNETLARPEALRDGRAKSCGKKNCKATLVDLKGLRFGRWVVLDRDGTAKRGTYWICQCDCGVVASVLGQSMKIGQSTSCGCHSIESRTTHGMANSDEYRIWGGMKARCHNPRLDSFVYYGARGIRVCSRWADDDGFAKFFADMGPRPSPEHSIDRVDNNGDYSPDNCRWATAFEQAANTRRTRRVTFLGEHYSETGFARLLGVKREVVRRMRKRGMSPEETAKSIRDHDSTTSD